MYKRQIDPIDGTSNFIHGIPHVGIIVAKMTNDEITDGVIYNPILNEFFWSSKGKGSWCNNSRLRVSNRQIFSDCLIGTGLPFGERIYKNYLSEVDEILKSSAFIFAITILSSIAVIYFVNNYEWWLIGGIFFGNFSLNTS